MSTTTPAELGQRMLAEMASIPVIIPGKVCKRKGPGGKVTGWKLQRWQKGRNRTQYLPAELVEKAQEGTAGHERFMVLAREYADVKGEEAMKALRSPADSKKKPTRR